MKSVFLEGSKKGGHYTPGMISKGMLYISGQLPINYKTGEMVEGGLEEQVSQALHNLEMVLKSAGLEKNDVVQCRVYTPDIANWGRIDELYSAFFGEHKPARAVVPTKELHYGALIEIEAVAEMED